MVVDIESLPVMMTGGKLRISMIVVIVKMPLVLLRLISTCVIRWSAIDRLLKLPRWIPLVCSLWCRFWITTTF